MMTVKLLYAGSISWYRVDSHWDTSSHQLASSWGPGLKLSTSWYSGSDNNGSTDIGKTYVFAIGDGSGISINHISFSTVAPTTNTSAGTGTNALVTQSTEYSKAFENLYLNDFCSTTSVLLEGTDDISALSTVVKAFSDGYKISSSLAMDSFFAGAREAWRGTCIVYYTSETVLDATNGSLCHVISRDSLATAGLFDFGASYLIHVSPTNWAPPASNASIVPKDLALSDSKYGITHSPSVATNYIMAANFYSTVAWYQPKAAASYSLVRRYGKSDVVSGYCMQGSGSTTYFSPPKESLAL